MGLINRLHQNRMDEARQAYEEALHIYERFAKRNPDRFAGDVARLQQLLAELEH